MFPFLSTQATFICAFFVAKFVLFVYYCMGSSVEDTSSGIDDRHLDNCTAKNHKDIDPLMFQESKGMFYKLSLYKQRVT